MDVKILLKLAVKNMYQMGTHSHMIYTLPCKTFVSHPVGWRPAIMLSLYYVAELDTILNLAAFYPHYIVLQ